MPIKLLVNLTPLRNPLTGIGYYTKNIITELLKRDVQLVGLRQGQRLERDEIAALLAALASDEEHTRAAPNNIRKLPSGLKNWLISGVRSLPGIYALKYCLVNWRARRHLTALAQEGYVYFEPSFVPMVFTGKVVTTIHDLSFITYPHFHPQERVAFLTERVRTAVASSAHLLVDSDSIAGELCRHYGVDAATVSTIHLGVERDFKPYSASECLAILTRFGLHYKGFMLTVATLEPRKNLARLVNAYRALPDAIKARYPLVLVGHAGWDNDELFSANQDLLASQRLIITGYVNEHDLRRLYASARLFAYPSLYEGFGLPILEAMASGTAVLSSNRGATAEVAGSAALLVVPECIPAITSAMQTILSDKSVRSSLETKSRVRAQQFSWPTCADEILAVVSKL